MHKGMCKMMFVYKIKAIRKRCVAMCKGMRKMMLVYNVIAMRKGCVSYA